MKNYFVLTGVCVLLLLFVNGCRHDKGIPQYNGFPEDVGRIFFTKCATAGCHTDISKGAAAGLSLESWDRLFEGGKTSAAVIPFRYDQSTLFYYVNTFSDLGLTLQPTMPFNSTALTREEVLIIKNWIDLGAPNNQGLVKFSDNPNRKKFYVTNQGCDMVTVFDAETQLPMRYVNVGNSGGTESPHMVKVSPDGHYWYVLSLAGNSLQKYRSSDDSFVGEAIIGGGQNWNTFTISHDGSKAYAVNWVAAGDIAEIDLSTLTVTHNVGFNYPHGSCLNAAGDTLYITQQTNSSKLYKIPVNDFSAFSEVNLSTTPPVTSLNPHEILFSPDGDEYYVTCQGLPELRILQQGTDQLLDVIPLGGMPSEMAISTNNNYLFITCMEDTLSFPGKRGSVWVMDIASHTIVQTLYTGHQPHGIAVDDAKNIAIVVNRNFTQGGPAPHHASSCGGKNGYVTFIDMSTLSLVKSGNSDKKIEISVDPYFVAIRD